MSVKQQLLHALWAVHAATRVTQSVSMAFSRHQSLLRMGAGGLLSRPRGCMARCSCRRTTPPSSQARLLALPLCGPALKGLCIHQPPPVQPAPDTGTRLRAAATANQTHNANGTVALALTAWLTSPRPSTETGVLAVASPHNVNWTASAPVSFGTSNETSVTVQVRVVPEALDTLQMKGSCACSPGACPLAAPPDGQEVRR